MYYINIYIYICISNRACGPTRHRAQEISGLCGRRFCVGLARVSCCRRRVVCALFRAFRCFFEGAPPSGDHSLSSKGAGGWPRRLGDDFVTILWIWASFWDLPRVTFEGGWAPEASNVPPRELFWRLFGSLDTSTENTSQTNHKRTLVLRSFVAVGFLER